MNEGSKEDFHSKSFFFHSKEGLKLFRLKAEAVGCIVQEHKRPWGGLVAEVVAPKKLLYKRSIVHKLWEHYRQGPFQLEILDNGSLIR